MIARLFAFVGANTGLRRIDKTEIWVDEPLLEAKRLNVRLSVTVSSGRAWVVRNQPGLFQRAGDFQHQG